MALPSPATPDFVKSLPIAHAADGEVMLAWAMNGAELPFLNGYPLRLVVPGFYGTYWMKHLFEITVLDQKFDGFWMAGAYRIPDNDCACVPPGTAAGKTRPIGRFNVRSFVTSLSDGAHVPAGGNLPLRGIAFDGGSGIRGVRVSADDGASWAEATLGQDLGRFAFRPWTLSVAPAGRAPRHQGAGHRQQRRGAAAGATLEPFGLHAQRGRDSDRGGHVTRPMFHPMVRAALVMTLGALGALGALEALGGTAVAAPFVYTLPEETAAFAPGPNLEVAQANCGACHSADYISTQPRGLADPRAFWSGEVTKMRNVYKAEISDADVPQIVAYLVATYGH